MLLETEYFEKTPLQVTRFINQHSHTAQSLQIKYRNNYLTSYSHFIIQPTAATRAIINIPKILEWMQVLLFTCHGWLPAVHQTWFTDCKWLHQSKIHIHSLHTHITDTLKIVWFQITGLRITCQHIAANTQCISLQSSCMCHGHGPPKTTVLYLYMEHLWQILQ